MVVQRHPVLHDIVKDLRRLLWHTIVGTCRFIYNIGNDVHFFIVSNLFAVFLLPTHLLFIAVLGFVWMLISDTIVYTTLEFGRIIGDILAPLQVRRVCG